MRLTSKSKGEGNENKVKREKGELDKTEEGSY